MKKSFTKIRVLAVASSGGHWVQLQRMRLAWDGCDVSYITTQIGYKQQVLDDANVRKLAEPGYYVVVDASRWQKLRLIWQMLQILRIVIKVRPNVVVSTGAAPGFFALKFGKWLGSNTIWVDSIANAEALSLSGQKIQSSADVWLTQWQHLGDCNGQTETKPGFFGSVI